MSVPEITIAPVVWLKAPVVNDVPEPMFKFPVIVRFAPPVAEDVPVKVKFPPIAASEEGKFAAVLPLIARLPVTAVTLVIVTVPEPDSPRLL